MKKIIFLYFVLVSYASLCQSPQLEKEIELKITQKNGSPEAHLFTIKDENSNTIGHLMVAMEALKGKQSIVFNRFDDNLEIQKSSIEAEGTFLGSAQDSKKIYLFINEGLYSTTINCLSYDLETNEIKETKTKLKYGEYFYKLGQVEDNVFFLCVSYMKPTVYYCNTKTGEVKKHEELSDKINLDDFKSCVYEIYWNKEKDNATLLKVNGFNSRKLTNNWSMFEINSKTLEIEKEEKVNIPVADNISISEIYPDEDGLLLIGSNNDHISIIKIDENGNGSEEIIDFEDIPEFKENMGKNDKTSRFRLISNFINVEENNYKLGFQVIGFVTAEPNKTVSEITSEYYNQTVLLQTNKNGELIWGKAYIFSEGFNDPIISKFSNKGMKINNETSYNYSRINWNNESINFCTLSGEKINYLNLKTDGTIQKETNFKIPVYTNPSFNFDEFPIAVSKSTITSMTFEKIKNEYVYLVRKYSLK